MARVLSGCERCLQFPVGSRHPCTSTETLIEEHGTLELRSFQQLAPEISRQFFQCSRCDNWWMAEFNGYQGDLLVRPVSEKYARETGPISDGSG